MVRVRIEGDNDKKLPRVEVGRQGAGGDDTASSKEVNGQSGLFPTRRFPPPSSFEKNKTPVCFDIVPSRFLSCFVVCRFYRTTSGAFVGCARHVGEATEFLFFVIVLLGVSKCSNHSVIVQ